MCQACIPQLSTTTVAVAQPPDSTLPAPRQLSVLTFVAIIFCALMGFITVIGLLVWLILWLQPARMIL